MKWGLAAAVASAVAVTATSGAELLTCGCDTPAPAAAPAVTVGRCDGLVLSRQHHDDEESSLASRDNSHSGSHHGDRFAPRFYGLRFIETLIMAHR